MANEKNKETIKQGAKIGALGGAGIQLLSIPFNPGAKEVLKSPHYSSAVKATAMAIATGLNAAIGAGIGALGGALAYQFKGAN